MPYLVMVCCHYPSLPSQLPLGCIANWPQFKEKHYFAIASSADSCSLFIEMRPLGLYSELKACAFVDISAEC